MPYLSPKNLPNICGEYDKCEMLEMPVKKKKIKKIKRKRKRVSAYITADEILELEMTKRLNESLARYKEDIKAVKAREKKTMENVEKSLIQDTGPFWYQELSDVQVKAADILYESLRDDLEQGTVHRCYRLLSLLGIYPIVNDKCIRRALELSRGNDLAFLWFLMELFYNSSCPTNKNRKYTVNERILMSTICHLDMIPTLRELDKILPLPKNKVQSTHSESITVCNCRYFSPYQQPQIYPKVRSNVALPPPPLPGPNFGFYNHYKDPNFILPNEKNRWYSIKVKKPTPKTSTEAFINDLVCQHIFDVTNENFDRKAVLEGLCDDHEKLCKERGKQIKQLMAVTRCRCQDEIVDEKAIFRNKVITQIELDAAATKKEFMDLARSYQTQVIIKTLLRNIIENAPDLKNIRPCMNCKECIEEYNIYTRLYTKNKCSLEEIPEEKKYLNLGHEGKAKQKYFYKPTPTFTYRFDYEKIFRDAICKDPVKQGVHDALEVDKYQTEDKAITICMKDLWKLEVKMWNEKMEDMSDDDKSVESKCSSKRKKKKIVKKKKTEKEISSKNTRLMKTLLKNALRQMRDDPKFVLVTMPQVYNLKILEEWILVRYGHVYTREDREKAITHSRLQWNKLMNYKLRDIETPNVSDISDVATIDYNYRDRLSKMINTKKEQYHCELNYAMINESRLFWPTMAPYLCPSGCPREVFYTYMPSCKYNILPIRPWQSHEAKEAKPAVEDCEENKQK